MDIQYASPQTRLFEIEKEVTLSVIANIQTGGRDFLRNRNKEKLISLKLNF